VQVTPWRGFEPTLHTSFISFAQVCYEKRLVVAHDLTEENVGVAKGFAYGELGEIHSLLGNFEQAISCMERQLQAAR
jgi:hypothetical protein